MLFRLWGILPNETGRQDPFVLFRLLDDLEEETESSEIEMNEHLRMFYGE